jgi:hypothetical protein
MAFKVCLRGKLKKSLSLQTKLISTLASGTFFKNQESIV